MLDRIENVRQFSILSENGASTLLCIWVRVLYNPSTAEEIAMRYLVDVPGRRECGLIHKYLGFCANILLFSARADYRLQGELLTARKVRRVSFLSSRMPPLPESTCRGSEEALNLRKFQMTLLVYLSPIPHVHLTKINNK